MEQKKLLIPPMNLKMETGEGIFSGYACLWNENDSVNDTILQGAFTETLKQDLPKIFWNHDSDDLPIGKCLEIYEDEIGLFIKGQLTPGLSDAEDVFAALTHGTVDGLSIGFLMLPTSFEQKMGGGRVISKIDRLIEVSIVTFPCQTTAKITEVKSETINTTKELENYLRDAGHFSRNEAKKLVSIAKSLFENPRDAGTQENEALIHKLDNIINKIQKLS